MAASRTSLAGSRAAVAAAPRGAAARGGTRVRGRGSRATRRLTHGSIWAILAALVMCTMGMVNDAPWMVAAASCVVALGLAALDFARAPRGEFSPMAPYSLFMAATGFANAIGLRAANGDARDLYFLYTSERHLMLASLLGLAAATLPVLGFWTAARTGLLRPWFAAMPQLAGRVSDRYLPAVAGLLALTALAARYAFPGSPLGTLTDLYFIVPTLAIFVLARAGSERRVPGALRTAAAIAVVDFTRAALFAYMRVEIAAPIAAFGLGIMVGSRSLRVLLRPIFIPVYAGAIAFSLYFGALARARAVTYDPLQRLETVREYQEQIARTRRPEQTLLSRLTTFNQQSQIGRLVEESGFLEGGTLDYLGYAFIPRFLWPDKPIIAKGAWFAIRIGQGRATEDGRGTNAVNMTISGEFYLNFGWPGVILGCMAFGAILGVLWTKAGFWERGNVVGSAFGYYLFWSTMTVAGDLAIIVTMIALYLIFAAASFGLAVLGGARAPAPRRRVAAAPSAAP